MQGLNFHKSVGAITRENLENVKLIVSNALGISKNKIYELFCKELRLTDPNGKPQNRACSKVLANLEKTGQLTLPLQTFVPSKKSSDCSPDFNFELTIPPEEIKSENLSLNLVCSDEESVVWNSIAASVNGKTVNLVCRQLRYFIRCSDHILGIVGFSSPSINMACREKFIGWNKDLKTALLHHVLRMNIFHFHPNIDKNMLLPTVLKILPDIVYEDYFSKWNLPLKIIETYSIESGIGSYFTNAKLHFLGEKLEDTRSKSQDGEEKKYLSSFLYLYSGKKMWDEFSLTNKGESPIPIESSVDEEEFLKKEYADLDLGDKRRLDTLIYLLSLKIYSPDASFLEAIEGNSAIAQKVYRLLRVIDQKTQNDQGFLEKIINGYNTQYILRVRNQVLVAHLGDGAILNFSEKIKCKGMGVISSNNGVTSTKGLHGHNLLSLTPEGVILGIPRCAFKAFPKRKKDEQIADNQKKSHLWIEDADTIIDIAKRTPLTQHVYVADKEADDFNLSENFIL